MKHTERQREALCESIEHWLENWKNPLTANPRADGCECCIQFYESGFEECDGCPIYGYTGENECGNTPWEDACNSIEEAQKRQPDGIWFEYARAYSVSMYAFLCDVLFAGGTR